MKKLWELLITVVCVTVVLVSFVGAAMRALIPDDPCAADPCSTECLEQIKRTLERERDEFLRRLEELDKRHAARKRGIDA